MRSNIFIGIGSNLGNRTKHINDALNLMRLHGIQLKATSLMYENAAILPQGHDKHPEYLNCVIEVETSKSPRELLKSLQCIEKSIGRPLPSEDPSRGLGTQYAPRCIDLDLLIYGEEIIHDPLCQYGDISIQVPHPRLSERLFCIQPLADISSKYKSLIQPRLQEGQELRQVMPIGSSGNLWEIGTRTKVMGILNTTPDSFSDGSPDNDTNAFVERARMMLEDGCDIIDVGGYSTRPFAEDVSLQEEMDRVIPVIEKLSNSFPNCLISVDTFRSRVAKEALSAGALMVNDISFGEDPDMFSVVGTDALYVGMHRRGNPSTMTQLVDYGRDGVVETVRNYLKDRVGDCASIVPRWNVILDPGIGFAKTSEQSVDLMRNLSVIGFGNIPLLVGPSRKSFIGDMIKQKDPLERDWGTAAAVSACISHHVEFVRVHNVKAMKQVANVSDRLFRLRYNTTLE